MQKIIESKLAYRKQLAALPIAEKLCLLEKLRDRQLEIIAMREFLRDSLRDKTKPTDKPLLPR
jgi:hypothetical protein